MSIRSLPLCASLALRALRRRTLAVTVAFIAPAVVLGLLSMLAYCFWEMFFGDELFCE